MNEGACRTIGQNADQIHQQIPFSKIPGQSRIFLDYLSSGGNTSEFFPTDVASLDRISSFAREVLDRFPAHRAELCDILVDQNRRFGSSQAALSNIDRLRDVDCVAVLTGQQAGIFGGPLYMLYKALTAIKIAAALEQQGIKAVPVFWAATEDHDFDEISIAHGITEKGELFETKIDVDPADAGRSVGNIPIPTEFKKVVAEHLSRLGQTAFSPAIEKIIAECWQPGRTYGDAFCRFVADLLSDLGLIIVEPLDKRLRTLASPIIERTVEKIDKIITSLLQRNESLTAAGYHSQVLVTKGSVPFFIFDEEGHRRGLKREESGMFRLAGSKENITSDQLLKIASEQPEIFSPNALLRPVVQDSLFPTVCYVGGAAEIAYFAQNSVIYQLLDRPTTPIFHRQSLTLIESRHLRAIQRYGIEFCDLFDGYDQMMQKLIATFVNPLASQRFIEAEDKINYELDRLDSEIAKIDPTLSANLANRRRKINYHIHALQKKFYRVQGEKDKTLDRRLRALFSELYPKNGLQERTLGIDTFINRHGLALITEIYSSINVEGRDHLFLHI
ncbi:bacillithiol biosynthesis cysteine-adding enzyme BshC [Leptolyngbya sp. 7M]|uniref:bacillithiol biosynthesis cysteine-adding enzyme BshC n=1 Tax=Leptolyngbya sp. 7M TaxID=2812896 RepID=UPI001B8D161D|nr:bacillithiol biosynthesis cysteine-adding enzyme BshC [Leptolyngbya sp. 7M]QYO67631.1 bacillithiol biosynthesis cysteine-adding enzyme BshC [Leptolyngbya sp. 7M]